MKLLQVVRVLAVFGLHVLRDTTRTRSISRFRTADTAIVIITPSILGFDSAVFGYCSSYSQLLAVLRPAVL